MHLRVLHPREVRSGHLTSAQDTTEAHATCHLDCGSDTGSKASPCVHTTLGQTPSNWGQVKSRRSLIGSQTDLYGSTDTSGHTLHGTAESRALPTTYRTHGRMQRPKVAPEAAPGGRHRARAARSRSSRRRPRAVSRRSTCAVRGVGLVRAQDGCQPRRISRKRAVQRRKWKRSARRTVENESVHAQGRVNGVAACGIHRE